MAENNLITKEDLQNAVAKLVKLIQETAAATEAKILAKVDCRFAALQNDSTRVEQFAEPRPRRKKLKRKTSQNFDDSFERVWPPEFYELTQKEKAASVAEAWRKQNERIARDDERFKNSLPPELRHLSTEELNADLDRRIQAIKDRQQRHDKLLEEITKIRANKDLSWKEKVPLLNGIIEQSGFQYKARFTE